LEIELLEMTGIKGLVIYALGLYLLVFELTVINIINKPILPHIIGENRSLAIL